MREVVAYAAARFIEVVPEVELPGHCCSALASYPHLGCARPFSSPDPAPHPRMSARVASDPLTVAAQLSVLGGSSWDIGFLHQRMPSMTGTRCFRPKMQRPPRQALRVIAVA